MYNNPYERHFEIDVKKFPAVVIESDDWGACEVIPDAKMLDKYNAVMKKYNKSQGGESSSLERPDELENLYKVLEAHKGADGNSAVFTAYTAMGNPDFDAIRKNNFSQYVDIPVNKGFPAPWQGEGVVDKMREGMSRGVWFPEYHAMLHHTSPKLWMELLNGNSPASELARELFDLYSYYQLQHLPEFNGYDLHEQYQMINTGFQRFKETFGYMPNAAVTSDAFPETELIWLALGINTVPLKNCRVNTGEVVVYPTKPWNMQDVYAKIGDCSKIADACFLTRNVFLEVGNSLDEAVTTVSKVLKIYKEPVVISSHRANYCGFDRDVVKQRLERLDAVLSELDKMGVYYLTSAELSSIYRKGCSARKVGSKTLFRKWFDNAITPDYAEDLPVGNHWLDI